MKTKGITKEMIIRILDTTPKQVNGCDVYESEEGKITIKAEKDKLMYIIEPKIPTYKQEFLDYINELEPSIWLNSLNNYVSKHGNLDLDNFTEENVINFKQSVKEITTKLRNKFSDRINILLKEIDTLSSESEKLEKYV